MPDHPVTFRVVPIRPMECLQGAKTFLGEDYWLFLGIVLVAQIVASAGPMGILLGPMMCGLHLCHLQRDQGNRVRFETLFKGFDYFADSLIVAVLLVGGMVLMALPIYFVMVTSLFGGGMIVGRGAPVNPNVFFPGMLGIMAVMSGVMLIATVMIDAVSMFAFPLIVDHKMKGVDALKLSLNAMKANFGGVLGLVLLVNAMLFVGTMCCIIPGILLAPMRYAAYHLAYMKVFDMPAAQSRTAGPADSYAFNEEPTSIRERDYLD